MGKSLKCILTRFEKSGFRTFKQIPVQLAMVRSNGRSQIGFVSSNEIHQNLFNTEAVDSNYYVVDREELGAPR